MVYQFPRIVVVGSAIGTIYGCTVLFRERFKGPLYTKQMSLAGRTVIVTGANSGIGRATATELAKRGGRILLACRDVASGLEVQSEIIKESCNNNVHVRHLDLNSHQSILAFAQRIHTEEKRLDVLVNNAGVMLLKSQRYLTKNSLEQHLSTNFLGPYLLTRLLLSKLERTDAPRIVNIVSVSMDKCQMNFDDLNSSKRYQAYDAYGQSKLALMSFTKELSERYKGITSCAVFPGTTKTRIARGISDSKISSAIVGAPTSMFMRTPENACQTIVYCCCDPDVKSGQLYKDMKPLTWKSELTPIDSKRLWLIAEKWTDYPRHHQLLELNSYHSESSTPATL